MRLPAHQSAQWSLESADEQAVTGKLHVGQGGLLPGMQEFQAVGQRLLAVLVKMLLQGQAVSIGNLFLILEERVGEKRMKCLRQSGAIVED